VNTYKIKLRAPNRFWFSFSATCRANIKAFCILYKAETYKGLNLTAWITISVQNLILHAWAQKYPFFASPYLIGFFYVDCPTFNKINGAVFSHNKYLLKLKYLYKTVVGRTYFESFSRVAKRAFPTGDLQFQGSGIPVIRQKAITDVKNLPTFRDSPVFNAFRLATQCFSF
jgi:hypothetical protein